eukprot:jgi/Hompol1/5423/HPOL_004424-RA
MKLPPLFFGPTRPHMDVTLQVGDFVRDAVRRAQQILASSGSANESEFGSVSGSASAAGSASSGSIEIEVKLGWIVERDTRGRIALPILSETVVENLPAFKFESDMTRDQHATLNRRLNALVRPDSKVKSVHVREIDLFFNIAGLGRVRKTVIKASNQIKGVLIKRNVANLQVFLPSSPLDYRVSVNTETPKYVREKDRITYSLSPFQVDLTQVKTIGGASHERDLELHEVEVEITHPSIFIQQMDLEARGEPNIYYELIHSLLDNVRLLIRKSTPNTGHQGH